jgi:Hsp20/alpha crystallin family
LLHPVHLRIAEAEGSLTVEAEVPGFTPKDLEVNLESGRLTISGKRQIEEKHKDKKTVYTERCADQVLRVHRPACRGQHLERHGNTQGRDLTSDDAKGQRRQERACRCEGGVTTFEEPQQDQGDGGFDPNCFFLRRFRI